MEFKFTCGIYFFTQAKAFKNARNNVSGIPGWAVIKITEQFVGESNP